KHKVISYPRTNSNYVTEQNIPEMHKSLSALQGTAYHELVQGAAAATWRRSCARARAVSAEASPRKLNVTWTSCGCVHFWKGSAFWRLPAQSSSSRCTSGGSAMPTNSR
ncbi:hypothetical protein P4I72_15965, partial [Paenibacillus alba]